jgi:hypothetical protein
MKPNPKNPSSEVLAAMSYLRALANDRPFVFEKTVHNLGLSTLLSK